MTWMQTNSRQKVDLLNPDPNSIALHDIAHALSRICRYNGHVVAHYSVAEHCCLVSDYLLQVYPNDPSVAFAGLLHDASEAYVGDLTSPMQLALGDAGRQAVKDMHHRMWRAIAKRLRVSDYVDIESPDVKAADRRICLDECDALLGGPIQPWNIGGGKLGVKIRGWEAWMAELQWLRRYKIFGGHVPSRDEVTRG
jgi:hypothetical protein